MFGNPPKWDSKVLKAFATVLPRNFIIAEACTRTFSGGVVTVIGAL